MDKDYLILKTMARFSVSYHIAKILINDLEQREELEGYAHYIDKFPNYQDVRKFYYGGN
jgi:hypothetical protein